MSFVSDIIDEVTDFAERSLDWVGDKLGDTIDWASENPAEALAVGALIYGGYQLLSETAATTTAASASVVGGSSAGTAGSTALVGAETAGVGEATAGLLDAAATSTSASVSPGLAPMPSAEVLAETGGVIQAPAPSQSGFIQTSAPGAPGMNPHELAMADSQAGLLDTVTPGTFVEGPGAESSFWDSPYAMPSAAMLSGQVLSAYSAGKARDEEEKRRNRQTYFGVRNDNAGAGVDVGGVGAGLLNIGKNYSTANRVSRPDFNVNYSPRRR